MPSTHLGILFRVGEAVTVGPGGALGLKHVQIVEALGMRPRPAKEIELVMDVAKGHSCPGHGAVSDDADLGPDAQVKINHEEVVQSFRAVPAAENVQVLLDEA